MPEEKKHTGKVHDSYIFTVHDIVTRDRHYFLENVKIPLIFDNDDCCLSPSAAQDLK